MIGEIARTFGVDWPHLLAQFVSFGIVCAVLYWYAYTPILQILEARQTAAWLVQSHLKKQTAVT